MKKKEKSNVEKENSLVYKVYAIITVIYFILIINTMDGAKYAFPIIIILNLLIMISCISSFIFINKKYRDKFKEVKEYDYYRNLDIKNITAVASGILTKKTKIDINAIITVIYEMAEKNIIEIKYRDKKNFLSLKQHNKDIIDDLLNYEKSIIKFIFDSPEDTNKYCLEDILKELEINATKRYIVKDIEREIKDYINKKYYYNIVDYMKNQENLFFVKLSTMLCTIVTVFSALLAVIFLFAIRFANLFIILFYIGYIANLISLVYYCKVKFIKSQYHSEVQKIYGLYAYMSDYSLLKTQELKFYHLYNKYYVYAMGLGLADEFEKEFNQPTLDNNVRTALQFYVQNKEEL